MSRAWDSSLGLEACVSVARPPVAHVTDRAWTTGAHSYSLGAGRRGRAPRARCLLEPPPVSVCQGGRRRGASFLDSSYEAADLVTGPPSRPQLIAHGSPLPPSVTIMWSLGLQAAHGGPGGGWQGWLALGSCAAVALAACCPSHPGQSMLPHWAPRTLLGQRGSERPRVR